MKANQQDLAKQLFTRMTLLHMTFVIIAILQPRKPLTRTYDPKVPKVWLEPGATPDLRARPCIASTRVKIS